MKSRNAIPLAGLPGGPSIAAMGGITANERAAGRFMRDHAGHPAPLLTKDDDPPADLSEKDAKLLASIKKSLEKQIGETTDKVKELAEQATESKFGELEKARKQDADEQLTKLNELSEKFADLEQALEERPTGEDVAKSLGYQFVECDEFKSLVDEKGGRGRASIEVKASITSATTDTDGAAGAMLDPQRVPGVVPLGERTFFIQDMIAAGRMSQNAIEYVQMTGRNLNAAGVAEGDTKPQSDLKLALVTESAKVIAHTMKASRQILDDADMLATTIDGQLRYGANYTLENQILNGDGTGQNLSGLNSNATALALPAGADAPAGEYIAIENLRVAMLQAVLANFPATGHILNPIDWYNIETAKDGDNRYIVGNPGTSAIPRLWGLPVAVSQFQAVGTFLTGAFRMAAQYFTRWETRVEVATENEDDFVKNMVTMLCENRGALAVYQPSALITGSTTIAAA